MQELILAVHNGPHDAVAAVLIDYEVKAAVQLERLTRVKGDGSYPDLSIDETLAIVGATRRDVVVLAVSRSHYPVQYFRHFVDGRIDFVVTQRAIYEADASRRSGEAQSRS